MNEPVYGEEGAQEQREKFKLDDPSVPAIKGLGQFRGFRVACRIRRVIETWHVSGAMPAAAASDGRNPHALLAVAEPEQHLYPTLIPDLVEQFRGYAGRSGQVFLSTHSLLLLDSARLEEVFWLVKERGFTEVRRASDDDLLRALVAEGDMLGDLWRQRLFAGAGPQPAGRLSRERNRSPSFQNLIDGIEAPTPPQPHTTNT